jgi:hypothetical protein
LSHLQHLLFDIVVLGLSPLLLLWHLGLSIFLGLFLINVHSLWVFLILFRVVALGIGWLAGFFLLGSVFGTLLLVCGQFVHQLQGIESCQVVERIVATLIVGVMRSNLQASEEVRQGLEVVEGVLAIVDQVLADQITTRVVRKERCILVSAKGHLISDLQDQIEDVVVAFLDG